MSHLNKLLRRFLAATAVTLGAAVPLHVQAVTLSVDVDPATAGIQSTLTTVTPGEMFDVDIVITDAVGLAGFLFEVQFDLGVLSANSFVNRGFLPAGFPPPGINGNTVTLSGLGFGSTGSGDGILASITFTALNAGSTELDLVLDAPSPPFVFGLFQSGGIPVANPGVSDGTVTISAAQTSVPAPASGALLMLGLLGALLLRRRVSVQG